MPRKTYRRKTYRKKRYPTRRTNLQGLVSGFPKSRTVSMRYVQKNTLTSTVGTLGVNTYRANGPFDPDRTGTGHQPMGWDVWAGLYNHATVISSKISVKILTTHGQSSACGIYLNDDNVLPYASFEGFLEAKRGTSKMVTAQRNAVGMSTTFNAKRFFNIADVKDNIDRIGSSIAGVPAEECFYNIYYQDLNGLTNDATMVVTIDYIVTFAEPRDQAQS